MTLLLDKLKMVEEALRDRDVAFVALQHKVEACTRANKSLGIQIKILYYAHGVLTGCLAGLGVYLLVIK